MLLTNELSTTGLHNPRTWELRGIIMNENIRVLRLAECFKLRMARIEMDCNLKKFGQLFQVVSLCLRKITQK